MQLNPQRPLGKLNWIAAAALALGTSALLPSSSRADDRYDRWRDTHSDRNERNVDYDIPMKDVPPRVRETLNAERRGREIESVQFVRRDGKEFYRFRIDRKHSADLSIRISPDGRLLSIEEAGDK